MQEKKHCSLKTNQNQFVGAAAKTFSRSKALTCKGTRWCKRVSCLRCLEQRRRAFVCLPLEFCIKKQIGFHLTLTWHHDKTTQNEFFILERHGGAVWTTICQIIGPFIRVRAIGRNRCSPHFHVLLTERGLNKVIMKLGTLKGPNKPRVAAATITDLHGILGYLFDQNFVVTALNPSRPRTFRIATATRGCPMRFPKGRDWETIRSSEAL